MEKWLKERVLHRFLIENYSKIRYRGLKVIHVRDNKDQYPDLFFTLEDGKEIPVEVEWMSSDFARHNHDINLLKDGGGCLFVCLKDQELGFDVSQHQIDLAQFKNWFRHEAEGIAEDTIRGYREEKALRELPKLWFTYLSLKGSGVSHFEYALKHKTWGVQERYSPSVINQITSIQKGDLVAFVGPGRNFPGRIELKHWCMRNFKGFFELLRLYRVTHGYYFDKTKILDG